MALSKRSKKRVNKARKHDLGSTLLTKESPWPVQEAYKALRTNVSFMLPGSDCKIVAVTSGFPGDGKSSNVANIAIAFADIGKKVLLLDSDMRLPTLNRKVGVKGIPGLADLLTNQSSATEVMHKRVHGLDFISAGNIPPDPTWLLQSEQMKVFLQEMRKYYDWIFVDLPPITTVTDASILAENVDGYLLVVRHMMTEYRAVTDMISQLEKVNARILGFVYNDYQDTQSSYYKKYYRK